jgi:hypothetical protein
LVLALTPHAFGINLPGPLDLNGHSRVAFGGKDIRAPLFARGCRARHLCLGLPATSSRGLNGKELEVAMFLTLIGGRARANAPVRKERRPSRGSLQHNTC